MADKIRAMIIPVIIGMNLGVVAVALIFLQPTKTKLTAAQAQVAAYADSTTTARIAADSLRAELKALETVAAERDSFKVWYNEAVEILSSQGQAPPIATTTSVAATETTTEDWESIGR